MVETKLLRHPAVAAWSRLQPERVEPDGIEILKEKSGSRIYRLLGVGPGARAVIAKQRRLGPSGSLVERTAYEAVFPRLPVPALQYFGFVQDEDPQLGWLFLEDAGRTQYSAWLDEHRALAGRWLACLHCYGPDADQTRQLPDYTSARYLDYLQAAHDAILIGLSNPVLTANDTDLLRSMVRLLGRLGSRWNDVEDLSGQLPLTLALRNFVPRNSLIRSDERSLNLLIVDCESLAWANPVCDLAQSHQPFYGPDFSASPDIASYFQVVRDHWPRVDLQTIQQLANYGTVLRCLATISWDAPFLAMDWASGPMANMRSYHAILPHAMQMAGWAV
ncbi:MAG: hypothetical protein DMF89_18340 [Acidobacteria bacterium]|nr:MAG: hypothetical protein DMF89_18340 [Acidobacteriota bacterium]